MSKWDYLDEEYETYQRVEKIQKSMTPTGSVTEHLKFVEPRRNNAQKRLMYAQQRALKHPGFWD